MTDFTFKEHYKIEDLLTIMEILRSENGCPWDREQTHESIRKNLIEETYEVVEAIDEKSVPMLREELGDLLMQVVFHSQMESEVGSFNFDDVCDELCQKLIIRHPHVFGDVKADTSSEVLKNWEEIKQQQKGQNTATQTLNSVPKQLPALMRAQKLQHRAAKVGFDFKSMDGAMESLESELAELREAISEGNNEHACEELGDLLFSAVNVARFMKADAEECLTRSGEKFVKRFSVVEEIAESEGLDMSKADIEKLDELWAKAKFSVG